MAHQPVKRAWKGGSKSEPPLYELSPDDIWCKAARRRVALALGKWLIDAGITNTQRPVRSLNLWELEGMAEAAMAEYTDARCERYDQEQITEAIPSDRNRDLLLGA